MSRTRALTRKAGSPASKLAPSSGVCQADRRGKKGALTTFFWKSREELDIIPPVVRVGEYMQEVAVFPACPEHGGQQQLKLATLPRHPILKSAVSIAMLTWIM